MYDAKIQTPISSKVLSKAKIKARNAGFSSVNDVIRIIMKQFAEGKINFQVTLDKPNSNVMYVKDEEQENISKILKRIKSKNLDEIVDRDIVDL